MEHHGHRVTLVVLKPQNDTGSSEEEMPCFGVRRIHAAVLADPRLSDTQVTYIENPLIDVEEWIAQIEASRPDLVGFSVYVWSFPTLLDVARRLKARHPGIRVVFGGPSARTSVFSLPPHADSLRFVDAMSVGRDGEAAFCDVLALDEWTPASLRTVRGLAVPGAAGWISTPPRGPLSSLDDIASPYDFGLMPHGVMAYLETYRGCPLSCTFCEWGVTDDNRITFSTDYIIKELRAFEQAGAIGGFVLDAGLNLNARAFRNLVEAEREVQFFKNRSAIYEIYPSHMKDEHLEFIAHCGTSYLGIGLQSFERHVLDLMQRPFDEARFKKVVHEVAKIAPIELQIILGLPGDSPAGFKRTIMRALEFPSQVRVYYCLVLPDALLDRGDPSWNMQFDPYTMRMQSCMGWSEQDLRDTSDWLNDLAARSNGSAGEYWWTFPRPYHRRAA